MINDPLSIIQLTDLHILTNPGDKLLGVDTEYYFQNIFAHALTTQPDADLFLFTGDLAQDPCHSSYHRILSQLEKAPTSCVCLPGNHDDISLMEELLNQKNISCNKQILLKNWQIICLNSQKTGEESGYISAPELAFVAEHLQQYPDHHALIAVHHHCTPTGSPWMDKMQIENSREFLELLANFPQVKAITTGHIHQDLTHKQNCMQIFGSPSTCFQFKPHSPDFALDDIPPGYRTFKLYADGKIETKIIRLPELHGDVQMDSAGY
jgi:3',5'-cyclic-AMP phosphodiesterase